jgi:hypothetical protein
MTTRLSDAVRALTAHIKDDTVQTPLDPCPECGAAFIIGWGRNTGRFICQHRAMDPGRCRYAFRVIAREETLEAARQTAREWIKEHQRGGS